MSRVNDKNSLRSSSFGTLVCAILAISVLWSASELYLNFEGYTPHRSADLWTFESYDPLAGWTTVPGNRRTIGSYYVEDIRETVWPDGGRASRPDIYKEGRLRVLVVGCSYTYGLGVRDEETWVWKLNERFPDIVFDNYGVYAYGACQSMIREEQILNLRHRYDLVLYASIQDHPCRDATIGHILGDLSQTGPYVLNVRANIDRSGNLYTFSCEPRWFGDELSTSINFAKRIYYASQIRIPRDVRCRDKERIDNIFFACLKRMNEIAKANGCRFAVCALEDDEWGRDLKLSERSIDYPFFFAGNGREGEEDGPKFHVNGQKFAHPSALVHERWAKRIGDFFAETFYN